MNRHRCCGPRGGAVCKRTDSSIDPKGGCPTNARQLGFVQSDFDFQNEPAESDVFHHNLDKSIGDGSMRYTAFNGHAPQYVDEPTCVELEPGPLYPGGPSG